METPITQPVTIRTPAILVDATYVENTIIGRDDDIDVAAYNMLTLLIRYKKGSETTAEVKVDFADELYFPLAYDGQTANFATGEVVTGGTTGASGTIVIDTDGGATGTLTLKDVLPGPSGEYFRDNEALTGDIAGVAVVNGSMSPVTATTDEACWHRETSESVTTGTATVSEKTHQFTVSSGTKYFSRVIQPFSAKYIRVSSKCTGTATGSLMGIRGLLGRV